MSKKPNLLFRIFSFIKLLREQIPAMWKQFNTHVNFFHNLAEQQEQNNKLIDKAYFPITWYADKADTLLKIANIFRSGMLNDKHEDIDLSINWLKDILKSEQNAHASLLVLSMIDYVKFTQRQQSVNPNPKLSIIPEKTQWHLEVVSEEQQPTNPMAIIHVHGQLMFEGNELMSLCENMRVSDYQDGLPVKNMLNAFAANYHKITNQTKPSLVNWAYLFLK